MKVLSLSLSLSLSSVVIKCSQFATKIIQFWTHSVIKSTDYSLSCHAFVSKAYELKMFLQDSHLQCPYRSHTNRNMFSYSCLNIVFFSISLNKCQFAMPYQESGNVCRTLAANILFWLSFYPDHDVIIRKWRLLRFDDIVLWWIRIEGRQKRPRELDRICNA